MKKYSKLLIFLLSSLTITGVSFIDDKIWDAIIVWFGVIAYAIVGFLYSIHFISSKSEGSNAYWAIFAVLILIGYGVYRELQKFQQWILEWPLVWKIVVPIIIGILAVVSLVLMIYHWNDESYD